MDPNQDISAIRRKIRRQLPTSTFQQRPFRAAWMLVIVGFIALATAVAAIMSLTWYWLLIIGILLGNSYAMAGLLAHEILHGATINSRKWQNVLGYLGLGPFLVSPLLWRRWHNQLHHGKANKGDQDPDSLGTIKRYRKHPALILLTRLAPGSGTWYSYLFLFYAFIFHGQMVLWIQSKYRHDFKGINRRRIILETLLFMLLWLTLGILVGPYISLFVILLPMAIANFIVMSYIATNHFLRPQSQSNNPIQNSMSVTTFKLLDKLHFNFSHHIEHHMFPRLSGCQLPAVRHWLVGEIGKQYVCPPHWKAMLYLYKTPRVYLDGETLCDPRDVKHTQVNIANITDAINQMPIR